MKDPVYLDYNASAPLRPMVAEAMTATLGLVGNPSSVHGFGRRLRHHLENARRSVAAMVGADPESVVFTAGGTEANNLALNGRPEMAVLVGACEHPSVLETRPDAPRLPVDDQGVVRLDALEALLRDGAGPALVSVMLANNETGVIQPARAIADLVHDHGGLFHCDAVQAVGRMAVDMTALGADLLSLSAHKIGGPKGVGALILRPGLTWAPLLRGGGQERYRRAGTENLPGIVGFAAAAEHLGDVLAAQPRLADLRDALEAAMCAAVPEAVVHGRSAARLANTSCVSLPGIPGETQVMALDLAGVAVSAGSACSSGKIKASHVLAAMGAPAPDCAIRVSLGMETVQADISRFLEAWVKLSGRRHPGPAAAAGA